MITKLVNPNIGSNLAINTDHKKGAAGEDVEISQTPETPDRIFVLDAIQYSYRPESGAELLAAPIKGGIDIFVGDKLKWSADIPDFTGVLNLYIPGQSDKTTRVILKSGGSGYVGKLNVQWHLEAAK